MNVFFEKRENSTSVIVNEQRIDAQNAGEFRKYLLDLLASGNRTLIVNLSEVKFMDSSGLGALVYALREAKMKNGDVKVFHLKEQVISMFKVTRLNKIFEIVDFPES
ncbi:putative anti-sigma factor antagonist [bacterium BMS3Abin05]|nr:putative anti-sigma factor antagonist [bacterium BMS3Abin05]GBE28560.1 putative anti-sigma factor antagonist [bacterium BMS3Bbin03]HDK35967.1 anti-sigma factor antagonist [Bacteroidota bacterium]HDL78459.1 anti-sigma factor antagonist [Bacteroidota bacterium]HDZ12344.1 anti-sigma factor antagonist [Bacteroidota bacterium]